MNILMGNPNIESNPELYRDIKAIIDSGWVSIGEWVEALESRFKDETGCKHAIACNSATTGLTIAIKAAGWMGRKVVLPAFTWPSTLYAVMCNGNCPVYCDIDRDTWLSHDDIVPYDRIAVDTFGNMSPSYSTGKYHLNGKPYHSEVIYDAAHGYGMPNLGKRGLAEVVSLSFTKVVTAMEGGIILTDNDELASTATELRRLAGRMGEINARVALQSMDNYKANLAHRNMIAGIYSGNIKADVRYQKATYTPNHSVFSVLFLETVTRNAAMKRLAEDGIETKVYYDPLIPDLPNTNYVYNHILSLPIHGGVSREDAERISGIINDSSETTPGKKFLTENWDK